MKKASVSPGQFIKHKPLIYEECIPIYYTGIPLSER